jgi:hypothetical protein
MCQSGDIALRDLVINPLDGFKARLVLALCQNNDEVRNHERTT